MIPNEKNNNEDEDELSIYLNLVKFHKELIFIKKNHCDLDYWKNLEPKYPCLSKMIKDILSMQASQASSERLFSSAGNFFDKSRFRTKANTLRICLCLKNWNGKKNLF